METSEAAGFRPLSEEDVRQLRGCITGGRHGGSAIEQGREPSLFMLADERVGHKDGRDQDRAGHGRDAHPWSQERATLGFGRPGDDPTAQSRRNGHGSETPELAFNASRPVFENVPAAIVPLFVLHDLPPAAARSFSIP